MRSDLGWIDAEVFVQAQLHGPHSDTCRRALALLEAGEITAHVDPVSVQELVYALHEGLGWEKRQVAEYIATVLLWESIEVFGGAEPVVLAIHHWARHDNLPFAGALLGMRAKDSHSQVCSVEVPDLTRAGREERSTE